MTRPFFAKERYTDFAAFARHTERLLDVLTPRASADTPVDVQDLFARLTMDTAADFMFGARLDTLGGALPSAATAKLGPRGTLPEDEFGTFANAFDNAQLIVVERLTNQLLWPLAEMFHDRNAPNGAAVRRFLAPVVEKALADKALRREKGVPLDMDEATLLEYLADNTDGVYARIRAGPPLTSRRQRAHQRRDRQHDDRRPRHRTSSALAHTPLMPRRLRVSSRSSSISSRCIQTSARVCARKCCASVPPERRRTTCSAR